MFFWNSLAFFDDSAHIGNLISGSSAFSKFSLNIWTFVVHILLKPGLENFHHYFGIAFPWDWNENWHIPVLWPLLSFPNLLAYWVQHFHSCTFHLLGCEIATVSSWSCFCWLYRASPSLTAKNIITLISVMAIWWCPCVESSLVLLEEGVCYDQCVLLAKLC